MTDLATLKPVVQRLRERIGEQGPLIRRSIDEGALIKFAQATGQTDPLYVDPAAARSGPYGAILAAPTYLSTFCNDALPHGFFDFDVPLSLFLHSEDVVDVHGPILAGDVIDAQARYADVTARQGGRSGPLLMQVADIALINQRREEIATIRVIAVCLDAPAVRA